MNAKPGRALRTLGCAAAAIALGAAPALAAAEGEHHAPSWALTIFAAVNFAIFLYVLRRFAWPYIERYLQDRRTSLIEALEAADRARAEAEETRREYERRLEKLEAEAERAREEVLAVARVQAERLLEHARHAAERIRADARVVADQEVSRARRELREEAAALITERAARLVAERITPADQRRLIGEFVAAAEGAKP